MGGLHKLHVTFLKESVNQIGIGGGGGVSQSKVPSVAGVDIFWNSTCMSS